MMIVEWLSYLLVLAPFFAADWWVAALILGLVLLMRYTRRLNERIDSLRKTMNEAIIHDLKNPMAAVMGCLSCAVADELEPAQRAKLMEIALHSCRVQMSLLETLVDTSRLEHGELDPRMALLETRSLLSDCDKNIGATARHLGVLLKTEVDDAVPRAILADPDLLPRAIYNLVHNALKYSDVGGTVSLSVGLQGGAFRFEIKDTGIGIAPDRINRLFQKYYRVEGTDQTSRRGSGLGLYFCRLVVEAHGGSISVRSKVGEGTTVAFSIPQLEAKGELPYGPIEQPLAKPAAAV
jgi:signal transduction histidine kinase